MDSNEMRLVGQSQFTLRFAVPNNEINASTLFDTVLGIVTIVREANRQIDPSHRIDVKVRATAPGSFTVTLSLIDSTVLDAIKSIFTRDTITLAAEIVTILAPVLAVRSARRRKKTVTEETTEDDVTLVINGQPPLTIEKTVYNIIMLNPLIESGANTTLDALSKDREVEEFDIIDSEFKPILRIEKPELAELRTETPAISEDVTRIRTTHATLKVTSPVLEGKAKWGFRFLGVRIDAPIEDNAFLEKVAQGEPFRAGDELECYLQIGEEFDHSTGDYVAKGYSVLKVERHIPHPKQERIE